MSDTVTLNGRCFRYHVDVDGGRVWLEDDETKRQWQWLADRESEKTTPSEDEKHVPERVFLMTMDHVFRDGPDASSLGYVELDNHAGDASLRLLVYVSLAVDDDWRAKATLELTPLPLEEIDCVRARLHDACTAVARIETQLAAMAVESAQTRRTLAALDRDNRSNVVYQAVELTCLTVALFWSVLCGEHFDATRLLALLVVLKLAQSVADTLNYFW